MHWIGARSKWLPATPSIRSIASALTVYHVRGDCQNRLSVNRVAISGIFPQLAHECTDDPGGEVVNPIIVVAKPREIAFGLIIDHKTSVIAYRSNFCVAHCRKAVSNYGHARDAKSHRPQRSVVVQCHLKTLVSVLVVHIVNDVHGIDVHACEPLHHSFELVYYLVEIQVLIFDGTSRSYLVSGDLVSAAVDSVEEALGEIGSCSEELHLFAQQHRRYATRNGAVIPQCAPHDFVAFKLNGTRVDRHLGGKIAEPVGQSGRIPDRLDSVRARDQG